MSAPANVIDWAALGAIGAILQAVLSGAAIFAAAWLQDRSIRRHKTAQLRERQLGAVALIRVAEVHIRHLGSTLKGRSGSDVILSGKAKTVVSTDLKILRTFPVQSIGNPAAMGAFSETVGLVAVTIGYLDKAIRDIQTCHTWADVDPIVATVCERMVSLANDILQRDVDFREHAGLPVPDYPDMPRLIRVDPNTETPPN